MTNLERFDNNGIELLINTDTGESFATQAGYARMSGQSKQTVSARMVKLRGVKTAEIPTSQGLRTVRLIPEDLIAEWIVKDNPRIATQLMKLGVRVFLHQLAGFQVKSTASTAAEAYKVPQTYAEALLEAGRLALENEKLSAKIERDKPLVEYAQKIQFSDDSIELGEFARLINTGRTRLLTKMRDLGLLMKNSNIPYQKYFDAGYFEISQEIQEYHDQSTNQLKTRLVPYALITGKGQIWLHQKLQSFDGVEQKIVQKISQCVLGV